MRYSELSHKLGLDFNGNRIKFIKWYKKIIVTSIQKYSNKSSIMTLKFQISNGVGRKSD